MRIEPIGDAAIAITPAPSEFRTPPAAFADALRRTAHVAVVDILPAFDTVTVTYDPTAFRPGESPIELLTNWVRRTTTDTPETQQTPAPPLEFPVRYGGLAGPDLADVAVTLGMSVDAIISQHLTAIYTVAAVGFLPGFAYLDGLPAALHVPRRSTPRTRVPAGSVAIGGPYTGVYPVESPGGWHLIGRTTATLFDPRDPAAMRFRVGDRVRFVIEGGR
ncbi:MAG: 5-oxoprolinase subunit PxpB [Tepidisphaeraceae bacterium]